MISYVCLGTNNMSRAITFYDAMLAPLGLKRFTKPDTESSTGWAGWRADGTNSSQGLSLWVCTPFNGRAATVGNGTMVALKAESWLAVRAFHNAALVSGGTSEGEPGLRPQYDGDFYSAYIRDPDGNKLAAVCRGFTTDPGSRSLRAYRETDSV
jgi:catechol 2,3-dioxygenase-like lactoylglutathione lyase family enzyme